MNNVHLAGAKRNVGASQGYIGISVLSGEKFVALNARTGYANTVTTAWRPDAEELARLNAGASIYLELLSQQQVPMLLTVGDIP